MTNKPNRCESDHAFSTSRAATAWDCVRLRAGTMRKFGAQETGWPLQRQCEPRSGRDHEWPARQFQVPRPCFNNARRRWLHFKPVIQIRNAGRAAMLPVADVLTENSRELQEKKSRIFQKMSQFASTFQREKAKKLEMIKKPSKVGNLTQRPILEGKQAHALALGQTRPCADPRCILCIANPPSIAYRPVLPGPLPA